MIPKKPCIKLSIYALLLFSMDCMGQCTIKSDSVVCANDFLGFSVLNSGQVSSYYWNLGDGITSTLAEPIAQYNQFGTKNIQVTIQLKNGGICTASKSIFVHDRPIARMVFSSQSEFCFAANYVCLKDSSSPGKTGSPTSKRSILFGDGFADFSSPTAQNTVCYSYKTPGKYPIVMEVTDTKGCYARAYDSIEIYHNAAANFSYTLDDKCDVISLCLKNTSQLKKSEVEAFYWNYGDGTIDSFNWNPACHDYTVPGKYSVSFVVKTGPTCIDTLYKPALIDLDPRPIIQDIPVLSGCLGTSFSMADIGPAKERYSWCVSHDGSQDDTISNSSAISYTPGKIGDYTVKLTVEYGKCKKVVIFDTLKVNGPLASIASRNNALCLVGDTTYFCDVSNYTNTKGVKRMWHFSDPVAPSCTTDTKNGLNTGINCNYSVDQHPKHFYSLDSCYMPSLFLIDTVTLCQSTALKNVLIGKENPENTSLIVVNDQGCTGMNIDRGYHFLVGTCGDYKIMPDSAGTSGFIKNLHSWNYDNLTHPDGYVTIGLILLTSDTNSSCPGFSSGPACQDTLWYHHKIKVIEKPNPAFDVQKPHLCSNETANFTLKDTSDTEIRKVIWNWGDGSGTTLFLSPGQALPGTYPHTYQQNGSYRIKVLLENSEGCAEEDTFSLSVGHHSALILPENMCAGQCISLSDTIRYFGDSSAYWDMESRRAAGLEKVLWNWGDGTFDSLPSLKKCFPQPGVYNLTKTSTDSSGCVVTRTATYNVGGIKAAIRQHKGEVLCSEILQLFDSSFVQSPQTGETIVDYSWNFMDGSPLKKIQNPYHFYSYYGKFRISLVVESSFGCKDSAHINMNIIGPEPAFEFVTDTIGCVPLTVEMKNISNLCSHWIWYFGDPANSTLPTKYDSNAVFTYTQPGTYYLRLYGADSIFNGATGNKQFCSAIYPDLDVPGQIEKKVIVLPKPPVNFTMPEKVCVDESFVVRSTASNTYTLHHWDFGNGTSYSESARSTVRSYASPGTYQVKYTPTFLPDPSHGKACYDSLSKTIDVIDIKAAFHVDPDRSGPLHLQFINTSINAIAYDWTFTGLDSVYYKSSTARDPLHRFYPNQGRYEVCLKVRNELGCVDEVCSTYYLRHPKYIFIPNVFTPGDKDFSNDAFDIEIEGEETYHLQIYNRFGELVYESTSDGKRDDGINWRGANADNTLLPAGVYYVIFNYNFYYDEPVKYTGTVTIIR